MRCQPSRLICLLLLMMSVLVYPTTGQVAEEQDNPARAESEGSPLAGEAAALIELIDERTAKTKELKAQYQKAEGEDREITVRTSITTEEELRQALGELLENIEKQDKQGLDTGDARARATQELAKQSSALREQIKLVTEHIEEMRKGRDELEPDKLLTLEQKLSKTSTLLDQLIDAFLLNTERMQALGMDPTADQGYLDKLLGEHAENIKSRIMITQDKITDLTTQLANALADQQPPLEMELNALTERLAGTTASLSATIKMMQARDLDATEYSQVLIKATGEITGDILDTKVIYGLFQQWLSNGADWLKDNSAEITIKVIVILLILFVFKLLGNIVGRMVDRALATSKLQLSKLLKDFFISVSAKLIFFLGILIALSQLGIQLAPLLAGLGVAGFVIGFALQDTLSNFASGLMILIYRPYDVGDLIEAGGVMGKVNEMSLVSTTILTIDNQKLVVPNNKIWGDVIRNVTAQTKRRVDMTFGIGYSDDIAHAERVLNEIVAGHEKVLDDPETVIKLHTLGESSVDFVVRPWTRTEDYWDVYWDITRQVKERFDAEGISIPFPQRDVHMFQENSPTA